ncbi:MAG: aldehyde dehydrogenase family protein [Candidatus Micrarchaeota archaeon]|nr:aldehyde dehydrogenase family protein [Candidatus Micrarchaeota archaeon]
MEKFANESTYRRFMEKGREIEFDRMFDGAVEKAKRELLGKKYPMYIGGREALATEETAEYSPIDGSLIGRFQKGTREHARLAIDAAQKAFDSWSSMDYKERAAIMDNAASLFSKQKFEIAAVLSIENGKTRYESIGEVDEAIDFLHYYTIEMERNKGYSRKTGIGASDAKVSAGFQGAPGREEKVRIRLKPYGVFGVIAPFNFPISISVGMSSGALITGNTVVFKPSSTDNMTMLTGLMICRIFKDAGVPDGVFNYVTGPGSEVGDELATNPKVSGIAFTGSKETGMGMISRAYASGMQKAFVVEMGGKNPAIVSKNADLNEAVPGIISAAYGFCGQKCSALSRVYVHESRKEEFISKLLDGIRSINIGNPLIKENYMGPLISKKALERYTASVEEAKRSGRLVFGGNVVDKGMNGIYVEPVLAELDHSNMLFHKELFLPFLVVDTYKSFDEALRKANDSEYGLTAGLYSKKKSEIREFMRHIQSGVVYVNRETSATTGAIVGIHTFVGWKGSGISGKGTGSKFYLQQFMREQSESVVG